MASERLRLKEKRPVDANERTGCWVPDARAFTARKAEAEAHRSQVMAAALPSSIGALFDKAAQLYGERPFWVPIDGQGASYSYAAFNRETDRCGAALAAIGVGKGTHVAVMLPNVAEFAIAWIALAKLGAVLLPVNTAYTAREIEYVLSNADAEFLIIGSNYLDRYRVIEDGDRIARDHIVLWGEAVAGYPNTWARLMEQASPDAMPAVQVGHDDLAAIQYTSGSTGFPKGCMLGQLYWLTIGRVRMAQGPQVSRILIDTPFFYMGPQWRMLMAAYQGATLYVAMRFSLSGFSERIRAHDIDFAYAPDQVAKLPVAAGEINSLKWIAIAGVARDLQRKMETMFNSPVREIYGMTEIGAALNMLADDRLMVGSGSCGIEAPFRTCRIVDADGQDVKPGEVGELRVTGPGILQGYYKNPEATAAAFDGPWFRTGDLFRQDDNGYFYFVGRRKDIIRRSNQNISAVEIESILAAIPEVHQAAVVPVPDAFRGEEIKAYIVLRPGVTAERASPGYLADCCASQLAVYKLPRYFEYIDAMPLTSSNKIAKPDLIRRKDDLRQGSYDRIEGVWR